MRKFLTILLAIILSASIPEGVFAQTYLETFGQNRVQTRKYDWKYFDTEHFRVYHYDRAGKELARYVAEQAEKDIKIVEQKMGGQFPKRFNIILYNNYDEYKQTNVGRKYDAQLQDVPAGTVDLVGDRLVLYFDGEHKNLRRQLRSGMSRVVMERMIFGENFRQMVRNAVSLNLPKWVSAGFLAYLVDGWNTESETEWKNLLQANPKAGFYEFADKQPELAGKAFWKFIATRYGDATVKNLLYAMQMKSNLNKGLLLTIGQKIKPTYDSLLAFYDSIYAKDALAQNHPDSNAKAILEIDVPKDNTQISNIMLSPRGFDVAYVSWKEGTFKVVIQHTRDEQKSAVVLSGGRKDYNEPPDPNYPLLAWSNTGNKLAILYKQGSRTRLRIYNSQKAKLEDYIVPSNRFDRVLGMTFMEDDAMMVFSVIKRSQTDLYQFRIKGSRLTAITNDAWDDVQPWYASGGAYRGIVFLSNRPKPNLNVPIGVNELPTGPLNAFFYNTKAQRKELLQLSSITKGNITQPTQYGSDNFAYLYDSSGINNKYVVLFGRNTKNEDSAYAVPITNYSQSIIGHQYNPVGRQVADIIQVGDKYKIYFKPLQIPNNDSFFAHPKTTTLSGSNNKSTPPLTILPEGNTKEYEPINSTPILKSGNVFQSEFSNELKDEPIKETDTLLDAEGNDIIPDAPYKTGEVDSIKVDSSFVKMRAQPYRIAFKPDFFTVRVDNSVLFSKYQSTLTDINQNLGGMLTVSLDDVLENHRVTGGIRLPVNLGGMAYFLQYENFSRRVDWSVLYVRTSATNRYVVNYFDSSNTLVYTNPDQLGKAVTNIVQGSASYPLDRIRSFKLHLGVRQDVVHYKAQDLPALIAAKSDYQYWAMSRAEYISDNTVNPVLNIRKGLRYKLFAEYMYRLNSPNTGCFNFGFDVRNYTKIYKNIVLASRVAYAHSSGKENINYVLGGVDNWLFAKQNNLPTANGEAFAFQSLATNMRGYDQNARHGNTYGVINIEMRAPILTALIKKPIQSNILKNLQLLAFVDAGNAWNGLLPLTENMQQSYSFTYFTAPRQPVTVNVNPGNTGLAMGYGAGLRTMLFGYFLRLDAAWNIEGRRRPIWYFSIGTDF